MKAYNLQALAASLLSLVGDIELYSVFCQQCRQLSFMLLKTTY